MICFSHSYLLVASRVAHWEKLMVENLAEWKVVLDINQVVIMCREEEQKKSESCNTMVQY